MCTNVPSKEFLKCEVEGAISDSKNKQDREILGVDVIDSGFHDTGVGKAGLWLPAGLCRGI